MSVALTNQIVAGLREYGVTVHFWNGWDRRGNGQVFDCAGCIMHHTATGFGMAPSLLVNGRSDLPGPLCNSSGNSDGSITIISANPANHAGASGGRSMGPLPVTSLFNKRTWGHEIVYPGVEPMTVAQYKSMIILGKVITEVLGRPNSEWIRAHGETSITGKWDPGFAGGKTIDMAQVREDINNFKGGEDDLSEKAENLIEELHQALISGSFERFHKGESTRIARDLGHIKNQVNANVDVVETKVASLQTSLNNLTARVNSLSTVTVDEAAIAREVVAAINASDADRLTAEELEEAVKKAVKTTIRDQWAK